eukprot:CAMPEP_0113331198 /NCGR_PEP_ID=MMETSP0010_2-20120614/22325_1 /TAXON_ID=216773 ORGANISM="Corethron hystrix, Strain 308" /NCGR_SAMPLE_ID=MMETSP0010_2 /ASSEMBLY_ACC=CAM_ASM_000155 /LENGTH=419 /DNA_ID=CAMNT_0000194377 /DNA_START=24 /DNA_END=1283 /DNA_ORIENTATION=+ /assembly_acc=CAM_ASM_000155
MLADEDTNLGYPTPSHKKASLCVRVGIASCLLASIYVFQSLTNWNRIETFTPWTKAVSGDENPNEVSLGNDIKELIETQQPSCKVDHAALSRAKTEAASLKKLTPLDREYFTIRMNTWKRNAQLLASIDHHAMCEGVLQIQIIWSDPDAEPPSEVINHKSGKVVVERHAVNSLNERFNMILISLDDDLLRPCDALDSGFFRWKRNPNRMVGFDARSHVEDEEGWKYGSMSTTKKANTYSLILTRAAFVHSDYLKIYMDHLPRNIFNYVAINFNCEDIAMSLLVSALTGGRVPLLADLWALRSQIKVSHENAISSKKGHMSSRSNCVECFTRVLDLRSKEGHIQLSPLLESKKQIFRVGEKSGNSNDFDAAEATIIKRESDLIARLKEWVKMDKSEFRKHWNEMLGEVRSVLESHDLHVD